jgi:non-homologous end joining protein Ku
LFAKNRDRQSAGAQARQVIDIMEALKRSVERVPAKKKLATANKKNKVL